MWNKFCTAVNTVLATTLILGTLIVISFGSIITAIIGVMVLFIAAIVLIVTEDKEEDDGAD